MAGGRQKNKPVPQRVPLMGIEQKMNETSEASKYAELAPLSTPSASRLCVLNAGIKPDPFAMQCEKKNQTLETAALPSSPSARLLCPK